MLMEQPSKKYLAVGAVAMLCSGASFAFDDLGLGGEDFLSELPVVLTVNRLPQQQQNLPASVTVINRQMIEASGAKELPELLRLVAGFEVGHTNMIGPRATVTYHGMSDDFSRRMQVLVDGRSIYTPATGGVDWYGLPILMEDIERIEVTRGPNGVTYGANSFLGVINILTYHPNDVQGTLIKSVAGDNGYQRNLLRHAGKRGALDYRVSMEYQSDDGNAYYQDRNIDSVKDNKNIKSATIRADYRADINDYLTMQLGVSDGEVGAGFLGGITDPPHENSTNQYYAQIKWKRIFSTDNDIELQFYQNYSNSDADYFIPNLSTIFSITPDDVLTYFGHPDDPVYVPHSHQMRRNNIEFIHRSKPIDSLRVVWGAEARIDEVDSPGLIGVNNKVTNRLYRVFANTEWSPIDDWIVNTGVMIENNEITDTQLTPRIALNYSLSPNHSIRTSYSVNYRTPAILEEYADYGGRFYTDDQMIDQIWISYGNLKPEKSTSYEVALVGSSKDRALSYDVRLFKDSMEDLIAVPIDHNFVEPYSALCAPPFSISMFCRSSVISNGGSVDLTGMEVQAKLKATARTMLSLGLSHVTTSGKMLDDINPTNYISLNKHVPTDTISVLVDQKFSDSWQVSVGHYRVGNMRFFGGDETGGIETTDLRVAKQIKLNGVNGQLAVIVQDVNGTYYDFRSDIPRTQSAYLTAELTF